MAHRLWFGLVAAVILGGCDKTDAASPPTPELAAAEASAAMAFSAESDDDADYVETVQLPADTTPPPKAGNFPEETRVFHRKSPYFEVTLNVKGDFRPYPEAFAALYRDNHDSLDSNLQTYAGRAGQSDRAATTLTLGAVTPRLVTVTVDDWSYTGGAHGNGEISVSIWDREAKKFVETKDIFIEDQSVPEADAYACKQYLDYYEMTDPRAAGCGDHFKYLEFSGFTERDHLITGVVVDTWPAYAMGRACAVIPYRLIKGSVKAEWQDQFADDPDFEAHTRGQCT